MTKYLTKAEKARFSTLGFAKAKYLQAQSNLRTTRGLCGIANQQLKKAKHILSGRPLVKGGPRPTWTEAQLNRAETLKVQAERMIGIYKSDIETMRDELRHRLLAYGFLRNRSLNQMGVSSFASIDVARLIQYTAADEATLRYWIKYPNNRCGGSNQKILTAKIKSKAIEDEIARLETERIQTQRHQEYENDRIRKWQESLTTMQASAAKSKAILADLEASQTKLQAQLKALNESVNTGVTA